MSELAVKAANDLKKHVRRYVRDNYEGQAVEVSCYIETNPDVLTHQTIMTARFQVKKVIADMQNAVVIDKKNLDYTESFSFSVFDSGVIIDG